MQNLNLMLYIVGSTMKTSTHLVYSILKLFGIINLGCDETVASPSTPTMTCPP